MRHAKGEQHWKLTQPIAVQRFVLAFFPLRKTVDRLLLLAMRPSDEPLASSGHFEYHNRPRHDFFWGILYAAALAFSVFGGLYGSVHR